MEYKSVKEAASEWNISRRRVQILCNNNRIPGVIKLSGVWVIPKDAQKPDKLKTGIKTTKDN